MFYFIGWVVFRSIFKLLWRLKIVGLENVLKQNRAIIASNHISLVDPPLVGSCIPIPIYYMAKQELFDIPIFGWILRKVNAFPVNRSEADFYAIRYAKKLLDKGKILLMFPQGGRRDVNDYNAKNGIGILSCWTQSPIIPCCIINSNSLSKFKQLIVHFLNPIFPPKEYTHKTYNDLTQEVMNQIKTLFRKYETYFDN